MLPAPSPQVTMPAVTASAVTNMLAIENRIMTSPDATTLSQIGMVITIATSVIGTLTTIGTVIWKLGLLHGKVNDLAEWVKMIASGGGPACVRHDQRLDDHERRLDSHDQTLAVLQRRSDRPFDCDGT